VLSRRSDGSLWSAGGAFGRRTSRPWHLRDVPRPDEPVRDVPWLDGAVVLYRGDALRCTGPMDEGYFLYYEEVDYHGRMRDAGWRVVVVPDAAAAQEPGMVPPYLEARNRIRWLRRRRRLVPLVFAIVEQVVLAGRLCARPGRRWEVGARLRGLRDGFTGTLDHDIALRRSDTNRANDSSC
jgi:N-acetylglucosaminyl-diphospho-decaprenol L-rhamnosyltransferase